VFAASLHLGALFGANENHLDIIVRVDLAPLSQYSEIDIEV
jgi:hypothetical protein